MRIKNKPISFNEGEEHLLEWAESRDKPFASYVKDLIREDIKRSKQTSKDELKDIIKELMKDMSIEPKTPAAEVDKEINLTEKGKSAYKNILKRSK